MIEGIEMVRTNRQSGMPQARRSKLGERINAWALQRLPSRRLAPLLKSIDETGLRFDVPAALAGQTDRSVSWISIERVVGTASEPLANGNIVLIFSLKNGGVLTVPENSLGFRKLTSDLNRHLPGARRFADWSLELVGSSAGPVEIFNRSNG